MDKLTKDNEKKIDEALKIINKITFSNADEIKDFKQEYKSNLSLKVFDLEDKYHNQSLATDMVVTELLTEKKSLKNEIAKLFNIIYLKSFLYIASFGIIFAVIVSIISTFIMEINIFDRFYVNKFFKLSLIILILSFILFVIWEITNVIKVKRTFLFLKKVLPINIIGILIIILCFILYQTGGNLFEASMLYILIMLMPIFNLLLIRKNK